MLAPPRSALSPVLSGIVDGERAFAGPELLELHVMSGCDNSCLACWNHSPLLAVRPANPEERRPPMPLATVEAVLDDLAALGGKAVLLSGAGEPLLHPRAWDLIAAVKARGLACHLVTYGGLLGEEGARRLVALGVDEVLVSLWAGSARGYRDAHPRTPVEMFARTVAVLETLAREKRRRGLARPRVALFQLLLRPNAHEAGEMLALAARVRADEVWLDVADVPAGADQRWREAVALDAPARAAAAAALARVPVVTGDEAGDWVIAAPSGFRFLAGDGPAPARLECPAGLAGTRIADEAAGRKRAGSVSDGPECSQTITPAHGCAHASQGEREEGAASPPAFQFDAALCADCGRRRHCPADAAGRVTAPATRWKQRAAFAAKLAASTEYRTQPSALSPQPSALSSAPAYRALIDALPCTIGWTYARVTIDGRLLPCCKGAPRVLGNVFETRFADLWRAPAYARFRRAARDLPKSDPAFAAIGCYEGCDNLERNRETLLRLRAAGVTIAEGGLRIAD